MPGIPSTCLYARATVAVLVLGGLLLLPKQPGRPGAALPLAEVPGVRRVATSTAVQDRHIRVRLTVEPVREARVELLETYVLRAVGTERTLARGTKQNPVSIRPVADGLLINDQKFKVSQLEIVPAGSPAVRFAGHLYRGALRVHRFPNDRLVLVNVLPLEDYLASVVDSEMPARFPDSAREAQAIIARTYALKQMHDAAPAAVYDVFATQRSQKYLGVEYESGGRRLAGESAASRNIVKQTAGLVCSYRGELFTAYYAACCGGRTTTGTEIFDDAGETLQSVTCDGCRDATRYRWTERVSVDDVVRAVTKIAPSRPRLSTVRTVQQSTGPGSGRISRFTVGDGTRSVEVTGVQLRAQLPKLLSPHFSLKVQGAEVVAEGRGHGHGVGLCQWGARGMALQGRSAIEILHHYYPGCRIAPAVD